MNTLWQRRTWSGIVVGGILLLGLGFVGRAFLPRYAPSASVSVAGNQSELFSKLGPGVSVAVFGGLRQVIANIFWLRGYLLWEARDPAGCEAAFAMAVAADPEEWFFWTNGARMMAYDFPRWELQQWRAQKGQWPDARTERWIRGQAAARALGWLEAAEAVFPQEPRVDIERAMIHLHALGDRRAAALAFRAAWEKPGAPLFTARIYAELMRGEGEARLAYDWYREWFLSLAPEIREKQAPIVLARIAELEEQLSVPREQRFAPPLSTRRS